jgi:short-subunit dehydrogenase
MKPLRSGAWIVTGAASGFGREFAVRLARRGVPLALFDRDADGLDATRALLPGATVYTATVDLASDDGVSKAVRDARDALGPIAHCVNSAGVLSFGRVETAPIADFRRMIEVNYLGSVKVAQAALPHLRDGSSSGRSVMLFVASIAGLRAAPEVGAYSASKYAVVGIARALRDEMIGTDVDVRALCPPAGDTPMIRNFSELPPIYKVTSKMTAQAIVGRALDALDRPGFEILVDAQSRALIAANRIAPRLAEWVVGRVARPR